MNPASTLVLVGPMGAGKSSVGRHLARRFGLDFVDLDREIERRTGASVNTIFDCEGEQGFRDRERAALADMLDRGQLVLATGGGAVLDPGSRGLMRELGFVVHLHVDVHDQLQRLARDRSRPLLAGDDREAVLQRLSEVRGPLYREVADLHFDTGAYPAGAAAAKLGRLLQEAWRRDASGRDAGRRAEPA